MKQIWTSLRAAICRLLHRRLLNSDAHWESLVAAVRYLGQDRVTTAATRAKAVWRQAVPRKGKQWFFLWLLRWRGVFNISRTTQRHVAATNVQRRDHIQKVAGGAPQISSSIANVAFCIAGSKSSSHKTCPCAISWNTSSTLFGSDRELRTVGRDEVWILSGSKNRIERPSRYKPATPHL